MLTSLPEVLGGRSAFSYSPPPPIKAPSAVSAVGGDRARDGGGGGWKENAHQKLKDISFLHILTIQDFCQPFNSILKELTLEGTME